MVLAQYWVYSIYIYFMYLRFNFSFKIQRFAEEKILVDATFPKNFDLKSSKQLILLVRQRSICDGSVKTPIHSAPLYFCPVDQMSYYTHVTNQSISARIFPNGYPVVGIIQRQVEVTGMRQTTPQQIGTHSRHKSQKQFNAKNKFTY